MSADMDSGGNAREKATSAPQTGTPKAPFPRRALLLCAALCLASLAGAHLLDALGLVEGLLSPQGGRLLWLVPLAALFYLTRFLALFVAPGLATGALILWLADRRSAPRPSSARRG